MGAEHKPTIVLRRNRLLCECSCGKWTRELTDCPHGYPEPLKVTLFHHWYHELEMLGHHVN